MSKRPMHIVVALMAGAAAGCSNAQRPEARTVNARIDTIDFQGVDTIFDIHVHNPNPFRIKSPEFRYGIDIAGREYTRSAQTTELDLPSGAAGTIRLPIRIEYAKLQATNARLRDANEIPYRLHGAVVATSQDGRSEIPVEHTGTLPLLRPPRFSVPRVKFADASLTGAKVALEVDVHNPNIFSLGLARIGYSMNVGRIPLGNVHASTVGELAARSSGKLSLVGEITAAGVLLRLARGEKPGDFGMAWEGTVQTPYGTATLPPGHLGFKP